MELSVPVLVTLGIVAAIAGFVDGIAGGGGLLTLPALLIAGLPPSYALGTNKGQSVFGSGAALYRFSKSQLLDRERAKISVVPALVGAACGVMLVRQLSPAILRPVVLVLLMSVAVFLLVRKTSTEMRPRMDRPQWMAMAMAALIAGYDGFFGPGTGTFLIMAYVGLWHDPMDAASANAKVVNFCSNLASVITFAWAGHVLWEIALPMALGQAIGGHFGAHVTVKGGQTLVRRVVIGVSLALVARLGWQIIDAW